MKKKLTKGIILCLLVALVLSFTACGLADQPGGGNLQVATSLLAGTGVPGESLGSEGNTYIDLGTYDLYSKDGGVWTLVGNIKGAKGDKGDPGDPGVNGTDGKDGAPGADGKDGLPGKDGANGKDGINGTDGKDGANGKDGSVVAIDKDGYWTIDGVSTGVYAGSSDKVAVAFDLGNGVTQNVTIPKGERVYFFLPEMPCAQFLNWYTDEARTSYYNFNNTVTAPLTLYAGWDIDYTALTAKIDTLWHESNYGKASCFGTSACFGSTWARYLKEDKGFYQGALGIANYLKDVFTYNEETDTASVNESSQLFKISYGYGLTLINFASAYSSYAEACLRNKDIDIDADIAKQVTYAKKYFMAVDDKAEGFHTHAGSGLTYPSLAVNMVAMGSLLGFATDTETKARYDALIKVTYKNIDNDFWNSPMYLTPFYQLCVGYEWFDKTPDYTEATRFTTAQIIEGYGYGVDMEKVNPEAYRAWLFSVLADGKVDTSERKALVYKAAKDAGAKVLGVYSPERALVD